MFTQPLLNNNYSWYRWISFYNVHFLLEESYRRTDAVSFWLVLFMLSLRFINAHCACHWHTNKRLNTVVFVLLRKTRRFFFPSSHDRRWQINLCYQDRHNIVDVFFIFNCCTHECIHYRWANASNVLDFDFNSYDAIIWRTNIDRAQNEMLLKLHWFIPWTTGFW